MNAIMRLVNQASSRKLAIFLFSLALSVRVVFSVYSYRQDVMQKFSDDVAYYHYGTEILRQGFFVTDLEGLGTYSSAVGPAMGWLVSITFLFFGTGWLQLFLVNSIISALTCSLAFLLFERYSSKLLAFITGIYLCLYFILFRFVATAGKEIWLAFFIVLSLYLLESIRFSSQYRKAKTIFLGFVYVMLFHLDERFLMFSPFILLYFLCVKTMAMRQRLLMSFIFCSCTLALSIPWCVRNFEVYGRVILVGVRTNAYTERFFNYDHIDYLDLDQAKSRYYISDSRIPSILRGEELYTDSGELVTQAQLDAMRQGYMPSDFSVWQTRLFSFIRFWQPFMPARGMYFQDGHRYVSWSWKHNLIVLVFYSWLLLFLPFGFQYLFKYHRWFGRVLLMSLISYSLLHAWMIPFCEDRYRMPFDVLIVFIGIVGLYYSTNKWVNWRQRISSWIIIRSR